MADRYFAQSGVVEPEMAAACIAGAQYFTLDRVVYAFNPIHDIIFLVGESCTPLNPILSCPAPGASINIYGTFLSAAHDGVPGLKYWRDDIRQWEPMRLFPSYGEAVSANPSLLGSFRGIELERDEDEEELFYSYGWPPTSESISQWVEDRKACHAPKVCPLKDCKQELRRPHALKDHLLFKFDIKEYKCGHAGCSKLFATQTNLTRHMKGCGAGST